MCSCRGFYLSTAIISRNYFLKSYVEVILYHCTCPKVCICSCGPMLILVLMCCVDVNIVVASMCGWCCVDVGVDVDVLMLM